MAAVVGPGAGPARPGRRIRFDDHCRALSRRSLQVEPDRTSHVQPDQRQLGRRAVDQLRSHAEAYSHYALVHRLSLPRFAGYEVLPDQGQAVRGSKVDRAAVETYRPTPMELHHPPTKWKRLSYFLTTPNGQEIPPNRELLTFLFLHVWGGSLSDSPFSRLQGFSPIIFRMESAVFSTSSKSLAFRCSCILCMSAAALPVLPVFWIHAGSSFWIL
jgi:hypothetical protein